MLHVKNRAGWLVAWVMSGALLASAANATTYHVAPPPLGSDANAGTAGAPLATIQAAANRVNPGDTVVVHAGTYQGFNVGRSGTAAAPITFMAGSGESVVISTQAPFPFNGSTPRARVNLDTVSHIVIDGFEIVGVPDQRTSKAGIRIVCPPGGDFGFITIRNVNCHHHGQWGMLTGHEHHITVEDSMFHDNVAEHGVYLSNSGDGHIVRRCRIFGNSSNGIHMNADASQGGDGVITGVTVEGNVIYGNGIGSTYTDSAGVVRTVAGGGSGINWDGVRQSVIRNNLLYDNHASGISLYRIDGLLGSADNLVANNTVINGSPANPSTRWCLNITDGSSGNTVLNNIFLNHHGSRGSVTISADSLPGFASDANIVMDRLDPDSDGPIATLTLLQWRAQTGQDAHSLVVPAGQWAGLFAGLGANDYRLSATSAARDRGLAVLAGRAAPSVDLLNVVRPAGAGFDIGAYEFPVACAADFNGDGVVDPDDLSDFIACYFMSPACAGADVNGDGRADPDDLSDYIAMFFGSC